jgi:hypothetical protein
MRPLVPVSALLILVALAPPAAAQERLASSLTNPYVLRAHGSARRSTGIALMVLGSLNLVVTLGVGLGMGIPCSRPGTECGLADVAMISTTASSAIVGGTLLAAGIPLYVQGQRAVERARREMDESPGAFVEPEALRPHPERDRKLGVRLLTAGALSLGVGLAGTAGVIATAYSPRSPSAAAEISTLCLSTVGGGLGIILLSTGGAYLARAHARRAEPPVRLSLRLGSSIALAGEM